MGRRGVVPPDDHHGRKRGDPQIHAAAAQSPAAHIGKISYGIYLLHTFVICLVKKPHFGSRPLICFLISVPLSIVAAAMVYAKFEQPIIAYYKQRFSPLAEPPDKTAAKTATIA